MTADNDSNQLVVERILMLLRERGHLRNWLARRSGIKYSTVCRVRNPETMQEITVNEADRLLQALGSSLSKMYIEDYMKGLIRVY